MPDRIARHRIIVGSGDTRKTIEPGTRIRTEDYGISAEELKGWDETGVVRKLRDQNPPEPAAAATGPRAEGEGSRVIEEDRSGPVADAISHVEPEEQLPHEPMSASVGDAAVAPADVSIEKPATRKPGGKGDDFDDL